MKPASFDTAEWIDAWRDRRPMTEDTVLVTFFYDGKFYVDTARYEKGSPIIGNMCTSIATKGWKAIGTVLAWMPLPEAYDPVAAAEQLPSGIFIDGESVRFIK